MRLNITPNDARWYELEDLENEIWKPVDECPTCYVCSNYGRIKTIPRNGTSKNGKILKPLMKKDGYYQVVLKVYGKSLYRRVNRIIASAFIRNTSNNPVVDHIDNNKTNNCANNLQWVTYQGNIQKYINEVYDGKYKGRGKIQNKRIKVYNFNPNCGWEPFKIYNSMFECSLDLFNTKNLRCGISKACKTGKTFHNYKFEYMEEGD